MHAYVPRSLGYVMSFGGTCVLLESHATICLRRNLLLTCLSSSVFNPSFAQEDFRYRFGSQKKSVAVTLCILSVKLAYLKIGLSIFRQKFVKCINLTLL